VIVSVTLDADFAKHHGLRLDFGLGSTRDGGHRPQQLIASNILKHLAEIITGSYRGGSSVHQPLRYVDYE
jgi:hypothetical protein